MLFCTLLPCRHERGEHGLALLMLQVQLDPAQGWLAAASEVHQAVGAHLRSSPQLSDQGPGWSVPVFVPLATRVQLVPADWQLTL